MPKKRSWQKMEYSKTVTDGKGKAVTDGKGGEVKSRGKPETKSKAKTSSTKTSKKSVGTTKKTKQYSGRGSVGMPTKRVPTDGGVSESERSNPIKGNKKTSGGPKTRPKVTGGKSTPKRSQTGPSKRRENMGKYNSMSPVGGALHRLVRGKSGGNPTNIRNSQKAYRKRRNK